MTSPVLRAVAVPAMLLGGALVSAQSQVNGRLAEELGDGARAGFAAALISFGSGLVLVVAVATALPSGRAGIVRLTRAVRVGRIRPVELIGGAFGAFLVATQGLTVGTIGVALFSVAVTAGQSASGLLVDHAGLGPSGRQRLSAPRVVAAAFAVVAVALAAGERLLGSFSTGLLFLALLPVLAGAGTAVQQALNGRLNAVGGPWATTVNNFIVGTALLAVCFAVSLLFGGRLDGLPGDWWLYLGGAMGVAFIWLAAVLVKVHGVLVLALSMIAGNVIGAELIEVFLAETHVGAIGILAGVLTVVGVLVAVLIRPAAPAPLP